jgi:hypothetical protein
VNAKCVELDIPLKNPEAGLPENKSKVRFIPWSIVRTKSGNYLMKCF